MLRKLVLRLCSLAIVTMQQRLFCFRFCFLELNPKEEEGEDKKLRWSDMSPQSFSNIHIDSQEF